MTKKIRLNDLQLVLLSHAAQNETGSMLPLPAAAAQDQERTTRELKLLFRRKLVEEVEVTGHALCWRRDGDRLLGLQLTAAAREALGVDPEENGAAGPKVAAEEPSVSSATPRAGSKFANVIALLEREQGATLEEMVHATGWLAHTTRAALTGLRKKGHTIEREKRDNVSSYRIEASA